MTVAVGVAKKVAYKKETTWNTLAGATGAKYLRRVTSDVDLSKDTYESNEIRADYQVADLRHGMRKVGGSLKGELSPGAYSAFMGSMLRKDFVALAALTGVSLTVAGSGPTYTVTGTGFLAGGLKAGLVVRLSVGSLNAANIAKNLFIVDTTATVATVIPGGDGTMVAEGPISGCTITAIGKYSWTPETGHVNDSYTIEHYFSDISKSEQFTGCRVATVDVNLPATGIATSDFAFMGGSMTPGSSQYFTTPTAATSFGLLTAVAGALRIGGVTYATITGLSMKVEGGHTTGAVVGSNITPDVFVGRVKVTGQMTAYFDGVTLRDYFLNETKFEILVVLYSDSTATSDFMTFSMYNAKGNGATKSDGEQGLILTIPFQALFNGAPATDTTDDTLRTTLMVQDSQAA